MLTTTQVFVLRHRREAMVSYAVSRGHPTFPYSIQGIDSSSSMAEIHVTKLAAAKRQLCVAVRIYFAGEDELAVHTVASAAYRLISDLKSQRGRGEVGGSTLDQRVLRCSELSAGEPTELHDGQSRIDAVDSSLGKRTSN